MGRRVTDGKALDFTAPDATAIVEGELYRVDNITHFAITSIDADADDRDYAGECSWAEYRCAVPAGTCGTRGGFVKWSSGSGFKKASTDLADEASALVKTANTVAQVTGVRNSGGYATLRLFFV